MVPYDLPHPSLNFKTCAVNEPHPPPLASAGVSSLSQNYDVLGCTYSLIFSYADIGILYINFCVSSLDRVLDTSGIQGIFGRGGIAGTFLF